MKKRMKKISVKLPNKLHAMLTKALDDLEKIESGKIKGFDINMDTFAHRLDRPGSVCEVCLGGTQLISKLPKGHLELNLHYDCTDATRRKIRALDCLRTGDVSSALGSIGKLPDDGAYLDRTTRWYHDAPKVWKAEMRLLATELEEANL
jgi:hypothetical protein